MTEKDAFLIPNAESQFQRLSDARIYSKLDLSSGYFQIKMDKSSRKYTAFGCELGFYEFKVMPMGFCNASPTLQRMMNKILQDHIDKFLIVYMDDILVYSQTLEEHEEHFFFTD